MQPTTRGHRSYERLVPRVPRALGLFGGAPSPMDAKGAGAPGAMPVPMGSMWGSGMLKMGGKSDGASAIAGTMPRGVIMCAAHKAGFTLASGLGRALGLGVPHVAVHEPVLGELAPEQERRTLCDGVRAAEMCSASNDGSGPPAPLVLHLERNFWSLFVSGLLYHATVRRSRCRATSSPARKGLRAPILPPHSL